MYLCFVAGIYIHIPFCKQACYYCDFHFSTSMEMKGSMVDAIVKEIAMQKDYLGGEEIGTIYFGGGTPSLLDKEDLSRIIHTIKLYHRVTAGEITLEANPDDLNKGKLEDLNELGVNRLSIGIQSFRDDILKFFNRAHNAADSVRSLKEARAAGFKNISIDLIYGVPGQADDAWLSGVEEALSFRPEHISAYSLTIEEKTVFGKWKASNRLTPMNEDLVAQQFEMLMDVLTANGYDHYEISNFGLPGFHSKHNGNYWNRVKYLGVGPSAHSYDGASRQFNISNNAIYVKKILGGEIPFEHELLTTSDKVNEYFFIGLRTSAGVDTAYLSNALDFQLSVEQIRYVEELVKLGHATFAGGIVKLTNKGKLLADKIASDLFVNPE